MLTFNHSTKSEWVKDIGENLFVRCGLLLDDRMITFIKSLKKKDIIDLANTLRYSGKIDFQILLSDLGYKGNYIYTIA